MAHPGKIRNIGKVSREWLYRIGIHSLDDLRACGAVAAYRMVRSQRTGVSLNLLWALEGAILDLDWRALPEERKEALRRDLRQLPPLG